MSGGAGNFGSGSVGSNASKPGYEVINKFGENLDIDQAETPIEIWSHGSGGPRFPFLDTGIAMDIVSTSADDSLAGIGSQKAIVTYYTTDNTKVELDVDLAGLTRVPIGDDVKFVSRVFLYQSGSNMSNVGEVNAVDRATGLVVYQSVEIGLSQTGSALQICEKGKTGIVKRTKVGYAKGQNPLGSADMRFNVRKANGTIVTKHSVLISSIKPSDTEEPPVGNVAELEEGDIAYWLCQSVSADNTPIEARFDMEVFDA